MVDQALQALAASGPLAILMGLVIVVLWKENRALRKKYEGDPGDAKTPATKGVIEEQRLAAQAREDEQRQHFEQRVDAERTENKAIMRELNETLKGYAEE